MKRVYFILFFLMSAYYSFSQVDAGPDKVICSGSGVEIGNMPEDPKFCYSWKASPADPNIANAKTAKVTVNPTQTTTYTLTVVGEDFSSSSSDDVKVTVIDPAKYTIDFEENLNQNFGFDKVTGSNDIFLCLDKNGSTKVNVKITPFTADAFCVTSNDPSKFKVPDDSVLLTGAITTIDLTGQNTGNNYESVLLEVRCTNKKGTVLKTLHVKLYKKLDIAKISYYRIKDATVAATTPAKNPTFDQLKTQLNGVYKQAVIEVLAVDGNRDQDIRYDLNKNGYLDYYNDGANPEKDVIEKAGLTGDPKIAYVEKLRDNWRLATAAKVGDQTIRMVTVSGLAAGSYRVGSATGAPEVITIASINAGTNTITLTNKLTSAHDLTHTLYGGLAGLSSNPQLITDAGGELIITIVHEVLHRAIFGNLKDVAETDNVMYWTTGGAAGNRKLRFRDQTVVNTGTGAPTGAKQNQWNAILR